MKQRFAFLADYAGLGNQGWSISLTETVIALLDDGATAASRDVRTPLYMSVLKLARGINGGPE